MPDRQPSATPTEVALRLARLLAQAAVRLAMQREQNEQSEA